MTACIACPRQRLRPALSRAATTVTAVVTAMTFAASGAAPTPLYPLYQESLGLSPFTVTIVFAAYVLSLLAALLTVGSLSGRRPAIMAALLLNVVAMVMFMTAASALALIAARVVQGFATGLATASLGAAILDTDWRRGPILNSITAFGGLTVGSFGAGALVTYAPDPYQLVYVVLLMLSAVEALVLWHMPGSVSAKPGALASLRPHVHVPARARAALFRTAPLTVASWALGGFYFSTMPALVRAATGATLPVVGGLVVSALTLSVTAGVLITLVGVQAQLAAVMLIGTIVSGAGFGAALSGTMRTVMPLAEADERAVLLSAFYIVGYLAFSLPAVVAGAAVPVVGLATVADVYGVAVILAALASAPALMLSRRTPRCG